jgi:hypothetical protein
MAPKLLDALRDRRMVVPFELSVPVAPRGRLLGCLAGPWGEQSTSTARTLDEVHDPADGWHIDPSTLRPVITDEQMLPGAALLRPSTRSARRVVEQ